jgi:hypothetical protein
MVRAGYGASGKFEGRLIHAAAEATQNLTGPMGRHFITMGPKKARTLAVPGLGEFPSARGGWRRGVAIRYAASPVPGERALGFTPGVPRRGCGRIGNEVRGLQDGRERRRAAAAHPGREVGAGYAEAPREFLVAADEVGGGL